MLGHTAIKWLLVIITLAIVSLVSVSPFLTDGMLITDDGNLHVYRSIVLDDAIRDGILYPRFAPAFAYGYGASLFNYFPPTSYYPIVIFHALGLTWVTAWKATMIVYVLLAALGMYLWSRQWVDEIGSFIATVAYIYAPYTLFDTITRGSSNEFLGMALLPFALWSFTRLARRGTRLRFLLAVLTYALFIIAHNVMTLYGSLFLIAYCAFLLFNAEHKFRLMWQMATAGILAVLMTAFFWLPALTETDFVKINGVLENLPFVDVTNTLRDMSAVFALPTTADPTRLQAPVPITFSWVVLILAIIGFFLPQSETNERRAAPILGVHMLMFATLLLVVLSQLSLSADAWQSVQLLRYSQFAWRPMSIGSLVLALLGGLGSSYLLNLISNRAAKLSALAVIISAIVLYSIPWLYRPTTSITAESVPDAQRYEIQSNQPVLSSYGEYLPAQTDATALDTTLFLENPDTERIQTSDVIKVESIEENGTRLNAEVITSSPAPITFNWLYVPGWRASVNGERVEVYAIGAAGLVGFDLPLGTSEIEVWYGQTPTQRNATFLSLAALVLTLLIFLFWKSPARRGQPARLSPVLVLTVGVISLTSIGLFTLKTLIIDQTNSPFRAQRYNDGELNNVAMPMSVNFDDEIQLLGVEILDDFQAGASAHLRLFWSVTDDIVDTDYSIIIQLLNPQGIVITEQTVFEPGGLATSNWLPDYYLSEDIEITIPPYTAPLEYEIVLGVFHADTGERLNILNERANPIGIDAPIGSVTVQRADDRPAPEDLPSPIVTSFGVRLLELSGFPESAQVGDELVLSILWDFLTVPETLPPLRLRWLSTNGTRLESVIPTYPVTTWQEGDVVREYQRYYVPASLAEDTHRLFLLIGEQIVDLNTRIDVSVPERNFEIPEFEHQSDTLWQNGIMLLGYDLTETEITLYWQAQTELPQQNLRLFVQVFDANGQLLLVDDTYPMNGLRPTTSWVVDEIITTQHNFGELQDGDYTVLIGWYDPLTGQRVLLNNSEDDALELPFTP